ncbi:uncharacterized protein LTR77_010581 [Saxophila tyrrhenica]|uniref:Alpha-galactosidase n=1 Tax=Saxophila tyrrhenica TaxID=1690608 RepID=A0AAV9NVF6_9PEZI|nr:hypothetical protein LTR77_010581 [Saxophila tyrrhenica]
MLQISWPLLAAAGLATASRPAKRLDNGLALTPPMGWNSYSIMQSNAKALKELGLADLGYYYVTTDCGWTLPHRAKDGTLTWNETIFPDGLPALGDYIHSLDLGFGVYSDAGVQMCMTGLPNQTGSLYHEQTDADTFASWNADLLKYDNCYSSKARGYPNVDYEPLHSPRPRYKTMLEALQDTGRKVLYQICDWGVDFPSAWAPQLGNTWRITNDIVPEWRTIWRQINQLPPSASYAGPGHWPDLDMLEVGNDIFTEPEEQTHFTLWALAKSPLTIGCALKDTFNAVSKSSLAILSNKDVIAINQDSLGKAVNLMRRYTDAGVDVWAGPLSGDRTVVALVNWNNQSISGQLHLSDAGVQSAGHVKDIWNDKTSSNVVTTYTGDVAAHGTLLLVLADTTPAGTYRTDQCGHSNGDRVTYSNVYGMTDSGEYTLTINFGKSNEDEKTVHVSTSASSEPQKIRTSTNAVSARISLKAGSANSITLKTSANVDSINVSHPEGKFYASTAFSVSGTASHHKCTPGLCAPVGSKIANLTAHGSASVTVPTDKRAGSSRYIELTYINNDVSLDSAWTNGTNTRNITVAVNGNAPHRLEVPLSGRSSELFSPMKGWGDPATLGMLVGGFGGAGGRDEIVVSNAGGGDGVQPYGADFVGLRVV